MEIGGNVQLINQNFQMHHAAIRKLIDRSEEANTVSHTLFNMIVQQNNTIEEMKKELDAMKKKVEQRSNINKLRDEFKALFCRTVVFTGRANDCVPRSALVTHIRNTPALNNHPYAQTFLGSQHISNNKLTAFVTDMFSNIQHGKVTLDKNTEVFCFTGIKFK